MWRSLRDPKFLRLQYRRVTVRQTDTTTTYRLEPARDGVSSVAAYMGANDDDGKERRQRDQHHVHAEIRTCKNNPVREKKEKV